MEQIPLPNQAEVKQLEGNTYELILEPLYPGYGVTIGNALRRVLLSSMPGGAVTAVKIKFVDHEFSTIPNVKEDVIQIILSLKQLRVRSFSPEPVRLSLKKKGEGVVTAGDIQGTDQVEIMNKDLHLCTLDNKNADLDMELIIEQGRGYVPVEARENGRLEAGMLAIDAIYTPVRSVYYDITNVRVGQITNYDKLTLHMETDGTMTGQEAVDIASHILVDHFSMMFSGAGNRLSNAAIDASEVEASDEVVETGGGEIIGPLVSGEESGRSLDDLNLSNRAKNALTKNGIITVEALEALSNDDINNMSGLGEKTINEIMIVLGREETQGN
jgi:DNA-directed RNA polymerase subunit alpha